jgi:hypothetical protein
MPLMAVSNVSLLKKMTSLVPSTTFSNQHTYLGLKQDDGGLLLPGSGDLLEGPIQVAVISCRWHATDDTRARTRIAIIETRVRT